MPAGIWQTLDHPIPSGVLVALALALLAWAGRSVRHHLRDLADLGTYVVPHFRPGVDEHGVLDDSYTLPARLDAAIAAQAETRDEVGRLSDTLTQHMASEETLRATDIAQRAEIDRERDEKLDGVIARLEAGNPEVRVR